MGKFFIVPDTHHGKQKVANLLRKEAEASGGPIKVVGTGDFLEYAANDNAPRDYKGHPWSKAYKEGNKKEMEKYEPDFFGYAVANTTGEPLNRIKSFLREGKMKAICGNGDTGTLAQKIAHSSGTNIKDLLGGKNSVVQFVPDLEVETVDKTAIVYLPHDPSFLSKYKDKKYEEVKGALKKDSSYQSKLEKISQAVGDSKNIAVLMHESPAPEDWYSGAKVEQRLPTPLRAHYNEVVGRLSKDHGDKKITVFHGHLHETSREYTWKTKQAHFPKVKVQGLNIDDVVKYDTVSGDYELKPARDDSVVRVDFKKKLYGTEKNEGEKKAHLEHGESNVVKADFGKDYHGKESGHKKEHYHEKKAA